MDMEIVVLQSVLANAKDEHQLRAGLIHAITLLDEVVPYAEELAEALRDVLREAVILSADYLEAFRDKPDDATIQGWDKARWKRALAAANKARAALAKSPFRPGSSEGDEAARAAEPLPETEHPQSKREDAEIGTGPVRNGFAPLTVAPSEGRDFVAEARARFRLGSNISYPSRVAANNVHRFIHEIADAYERLGILYQATCAAMCHERDDASHRSGASQGEKT